MEKSALITKRKKRKTRKCLNEIRNRSRNVNSNEEQEKCGKGLNSIRYNHSNMITMNRLTLAMFPKAVKSETITRPHLANIIRKQKIVATDIVRDSVIISSNSSSIADINGINGFDKVSRDSKKSQNNIDCFSGNSWKEDSDKTPGSCMLFSQVNEVPTSPNLAKTNTSTSLSTVTSPGITETSKNLYDEFMEEVNEHFKHLTAALVHEDVMWKTKEQLRKNYVRSCQKEYEDNVLKCIQSNLVKNKSDCHAEVANETATNGLILKDEKLGFLKEYSLSLSESPECRFSPSVSSDSENKLSACSPCNIFSPKQSTSDTPEYIFFPHRLN